MSLSKVALDHGRLLAVVFSPVDKPFSFLDHHNLELQLISRGGLAAFDCLEVKPNLSGSSNCDDSDFPSVQASV